MAKTILITGATDGIGLLAAQKLSALGHKVLLHGRSAEKLRAAAKDLGSSAETFQADLSIKRDVTRFGQEVTAKHPNLDVLINNAGVLKTPDTRTADGLDTRFMVNTIAPYALTKALLPIMHAKARVVNLSSAAQAPVDVDAMRGNGALDDMAAYSQSKLAITIWSQELARQLPDGPVFVAVNPGSLLATKMVKEGFGMAGNDLNIGADILCRAALDEGFASASGRYFDNDAGHFADPHPWAARSENSAAVMQALEELADF